MLPAFEEFRMYPFVDEYRLLLRLVFDSPFPKMEDRK